MTDQAIQDRKRGVAVAALILLLLVLAGGGYWMTRGASGRHDTASATGEGLRLPILGQGAGQALFRPAGNALPEGSAGRFAHSGGVGVTARGGDALSLQLVSVAAKSAPEPIARVGTSMIVAAADGLDRISGSAAVLALGDDVATGGERLARPFGGQPFGGGFGGGLVGGFAISQTAGGGTPGGEMPAQGAGPEAGPGAGSGTGSGNDGPQTPEGDRPGEDRPENSPAPGGSAEDDDAQGPAADQPPAGGGAGGATDDESAGGGNDAPAPGPGTGQAPKPGAAPPAPDAPPPPPGRENDAPPVNDPAPEDDPVADVEDELDDLPGGHLFDVVSGRDENDDDGESADDPGLGDIGDPVPTPGAMFLFGTAILAAGLSRMKR